MGKLPGKEKRCPLDVKIEEEKDCGKYVRRLITYVSEPGSRVPAYLLVPKDLLKGNRKSPAILCLHGTDNIVGHGTVVGLGKNANRNYASELAERGYVCLAPNYPLLAKYQPDVKKLGWESGTLKAIWDNIRRPRLSGFAPIRRCDGYGRDRPLAWRAQLGLHGGLRRAPQGGGVELWARFFPRLLQRR